MSYQFQTLKEALLFNTVETLPNGEQLDQEIQNLVDLANSSSQKIRHYIGFEISGFIHFPGSVYQMLSIARLQKAGVECVVWLADYHTRVNKKLDGKISTIRKVAREYFEPVLRKSLEIAGGDADKLVVLYAENEYFRKNDQEMSFWDYEFEVGENLSLNRVLRSLSIAGKEGGKEVNYTLTRYPGMQAADVFWLQTHIVQAGLDQRKIYVLTRDNAKHLDPSFQLKMGSKTVKPITFFNELLLGLQPTKKSGADLNQVEVNKMSKSKPDSAIWVHDSESEIQRKLKKAYCPQPNPQQTEAQIQEEQQWNPLLDWSRKFIFPAGKKVLIERPQKFGGNVTYLSFAELQTDYFAGKLHPMDLKNGIAKTLANWFEPVRNMVEKEINLQELFNFKK